ncbi:hypothetical protein BDZ89DRAFT_1103283 [Hymenopellis radicata]|nr:hypothetical protein BDZ89DRAFT_1103283 [Hymenopellis radicata]
MIPSLLYNEAKLCWGFVRRDLGTGLLPVPAFTMASLLYKDTPATELARPIAAAFLYGFFFLYTFNVANQITARPPIASGATSLKAATVRYYGLLVLFFAYSYALGVKKWTLLWIAIAYAYDFLGLSNFGPTKDMCLGLGAIAQLMAAWAIGGSSPQIGWEWTKVVAMYALWTFSVQDFRDVPGDLKGGRRTTPIILGDMSSRLYVSTGIIVTQSFLIKNRILEHRNDAAGRFMSAAIAFTSLLVVARLFAFRTLHADKITYRVYTVLFLLQLVAASVALKAH